MKRIVSAIMMAMLLAGAAQAATDYWDGTSGSWNAASGWSTSASAATPDPAGGAPALAAGVTIIDNQGSEPVEGAFADLPEGGVFEIGTGRLATITYAGGDGNDVVVTRQDRATVLILR